MQIIDNLHQKFDSIGALVFDSIAIEEASAERTAGERGRWRKKKWNKR